jgi:hypothetical protein
MLTLNQFAGFLPIFRPFGRLQSPFVVLPERDLAFVDRKFSFLLDFLLN